MAFKKRPATDAFGERGFIIETKMTVHSSRMKAPLVIDDTTNDNAGRSFAKLSKQSKWLCEFITGLPWAKRPLASAKFDTIVHEELRKEALRCDIILGQQAVHDENDAEFFSFGDSVSKRKQRQNRAVNKLSMECIDLMLPVEPGSAEMQTITFLNKTAKDCAWILVDETSLAWVERYVRAELLQLSAAHMQRALHTADVSENSGGERQVAHWCSAAGQWRVRCRMGGQWHVETFFVARRPAATFKDRLQAIRDTANAFYFEHHEEDSPLAS